MKKIILLFIIMLIPINVYATSGGIKADNIVSCNGKYYGYHGDDKHWHEAEKKDSGRWYPKGSAIYSSNPCSGTTKKTTTKKSTTKETTKKTSTSITTTTTTTTTTKKSTTKSTTKKTTSKKTTTKKSTSKSTTTSKKTSSKKTTTSKVTSTTKIKDTTKSSSKINTKIKDTTKSSSNITTTKEVEKETNEDVDVGGFFTILGTSVVGLIGYEFYVDKKRGVFNKK